MDGRGRISVLQLHAQETRTLLNRDAASRRRAECCHPSVAFGLEQRLHVVRFGMFGIDQLGFPYLEKRLSTRPVGVVSKKLIGDRKMAKVIRSCNFREAYASHALALQRFPV
jgi:hypothetical protein